jgi:hypothetical protein
LKVTRDDSSSKGGEDDVRDGCPKGGVDCCLDDGWEKLREIVSEPIT